MIKSGRTDVATLALGTLGFCIYAYRWLFGSWRGYRAMREF